MQININVNNLIAKEEEQDERNSYCTNLLIQCLFFFFSANNKFLLLLRSDCGVYMVYKLKESFRICSLHITDEINE